MQMPSQHIHSQHIRSRIMSLLQRFLCCSRYATDSEAAALAYNNHSVRERPLSGQLRILLRATGQLKTSRLKNNSDARATLVSRSSPLSKAIEYIGGIFEGRNQLRMILVYIEPIQSVQVD